MRRHRLRVDHVAAAIGQTNDHRVQPLEILRARLDVAKEHDNTRVIEADQRCWRRRGVERSVLQRPWRVGAGQRQRQMKVVEHDLPRRRVESKRGTGSGRRRTGRKQPVIEIDFDEAGNLLLPLCALLHRVDPVALQSPRNEHTENDRRHQHDDGKEADELQVPVQEVEHRQKSSRTHAPRIVKIPSGELHRSSTNRDPAELTGPVRQRGGRRFRPFK